MKDLVIVITGASSGIGATVAEVVGKRGARPVLVARRERALHEVAARCGANALPIVADVTKRADMQRVVDTTLAKFGQIDVWVNNAGRGITRPPSQLTDADVDEMMLVNLKSALYGMQAVLPHFKSRGRGHIINVSTMLARLPIVPIRSAYCAAKSALDSLTANLRMELRASDPNIVVSLVHPGVVATDFGLNAMHGGPDNRSLPGAQSVEECAAAIADVIEHPRAQAYTRPGMHEMVAGYYSAPDIGEAETKPPFARPR
jgi:NADP-dependent 3-hydroxy acid dehydrogenase YdfG